MLDVFIKWAQQEKKSIHRVVSDTPGLGISISTKLLLKHGIQQSFPYGRLSSDTVKDVISKDVRRISNKYPIQNFLHESVRKQIDFLKGMRTYRGFRHIVHLPVRGQRSKTNARTRKYNKPSFRSLCSSYRRERPSQNVIRGGIKRINSEKSVYKALDRERSRKRSLSLIRIK